MGEGLLPARRMSEDEKEPTWIDISYDFLIPSSGDPLSDITTSIYPDLVARYQDLEYLRECAILSSTNDIVDKVNDHVISLLLDEIHTFLSADKVSSVSDNFKMHSALYPTEYLNTFKFFGFPNHELRLKPGVLVMLL